jgi:hypothetical protein
VRRGRPSGRPRRKRCSGIACDQSSRTVQGHCVVRCEVRPR